MSSLLAMAVRGLSMGVGFGVAVGAVWLIGGAACRPQPVQAGADVVELVRARRVEVVDAAGRTRAVLGIGATQTTSLELYAPDGTPRTALTVDEQGYADIQLLNHTGKPQLSLTAAADGRALIALSDAATGRPRAALRLDRTGAPLLAFTDGHGAQRMGLTVLDDGTALLGMNDADGRLRSALAVSKAGSPGISLIDEQKTILWSAP